MTDLSRRRFVRNAAGVLVPAMLATRAKAGPLMILSGSRGVAAAGDLPYALPDPGEVVAIGTNTPIDFLPPDWTEAEVSRSLFGSYGLGTFVPQYSEHGAYVLAGTGGHNHEDHHGAFIFDFSTGEWDRQDNGNGVPLQGAASPHSYNEDTESNGSPWYEVTGSNVPLPPHPYCNAVPLNRGAQGSIAYITRAALGEGAANTGVCHRLDLASMVWSRLGSAAADRAGVEADSVFDAARNRCWLLMAQQHSFSSVPYFDLDDDTWKTVSATVGAGSNGYARSVLHDGYIIRNAEDNGDGLYLFDPDVPEWVGPLALSGTLPNAHDRWARYSDGNWYVAPKTGGSTLTRITPPGNPKTGTWTVDTVGLTGASLPVVFGAVDPAGEQDKFVQIAYIAAIDCLAWFSDGDHQVHIFKPPAV